MAATYNTLTLQLQTPAALPVSDIIGSSLDCVLLPQVTAQGIWDSLRSIITFSQPSFCLVAADGQLGALAPIGTVSYSGSTGAQTIVIAGVSTGFTAGATDAATALIAVAALNASAGVFLLASASVNPLVPTQVVVQGRWPGIAQNANTFTATGTGATASAATLGGSAVSPARAGVAITQVNQLGIGPPSTP